MISSCCLHTRRDSLLEELCEEIFNALVEKKFSHQRVLFLIDEEVNYAEIFL